MPLKSLNQLLQITEEVTDTPLKIYNCGSCSGFC